MKGLESIKCPLCGEADEKELFYKDSWRIVHCSNCKLVYVNPRVNEEQSKKLYNQQSISPMEYYKENEEGDYKTFKKRLKIVEKYAKKGKMLDIGCNIGTFLKAAKESGWDCYGTDINKKVKGECIKKGIKFYAKPLQKIKFKGNFFDVVVMDDLIEHVHSPKSLLKEVVRILKPGGLIFIVTPDVESVTFKVLKKRWHHLKPKEHIVYFSRVTIRRLLEIYDLKIVFMKNVGRCRKVGTIITKAESLSKIARLLKKIIPKRINEKIIPLNTLDELCIIAKKTV